MVGRERGECRERDKEREREKEILSSFGLDLAQIALIHIHRIDIRWKVERITTDEKKEKRETSRGTMVQNSLGLRQ